MPTKHPMWMFTASLVVNFLAFVDALFRGDSALKVLWQYAIVCLPALMYWLFDEQYKREVARVVRARMQV